jgi:multiple sugar transport system permease protein
LPGSGQRDPAPEDDFRLGSFLPAVPSVVAALMWGYLYGQSFGPIAQIAQALGLTPPQFLTPSGVIPALANISMWQYTGYNMLILFAALRAVPRELYEAAAVDGASEVQIALKIRPLFRGRPDGHLRSSARCANEPNVLTSIAPSSEPAFHAQLMSIRSPSAASSLIIQHRPLRCV